MRYSKSRLCGAILLILAAALLAVGVLAARADREGTSLNAPYSAALSEHDALVAAEEAAASVSENLERTAKRTAEAISEAESCVSAATQALETEQAGDYDPETDVGLLGQSILEAEAAGADVSAIKDSYAPVFNAELIAALDNALTTVKRAESAVETTAEALQSAIDAALAIDPTASFPELPALTEADTTKLGDSTGAQRQLTRGENYVLRGQTAQSNAEALSDAAAAILETVGAVIADNPVSAASRLIVFAHTRAADLLTAGALLAIVAAVLLFAPAWLANKWKLPLFRKGFWFTLTVALLAAALHYASGEMWDLMRQGVFDTLYMTLPATFFSYVLGLPLGVLLVITSPGHIRPNPTLNSVVGTVVNFLRSIPFIILLVMLFDVTRIVMGSAIGTRAVIFPLFVSAFPYVARIVEGSLNEVDRGVIEAAQSMGSTTWQIIRKVLIPEAMPSLINGAAICMTTILAYTAMAGSAGGDGLGKIAITYGLNYREYDIMYVSSLLLVALVQIIQIAGGILMRAADHRKK